MTFVIIYRKRYVTGKMVYGMFFQGRNFVPGLLVERAI